MFTVPLTYIAAGIEVALNGEACGIEQALKIPHPTCAGLYLEVAV
ncbi:hypothetical protein [Deinococcus arboris]|nr:hypothetical protein [Deinococcus arboris]